MSRSRLRNLPFGPRRLDVKGGQLAGKIRIAGAKRLVDRAMLARRALERGARRSRRRDLRPDPAVAVNCPDDRKAHAVLRGFHDDAVEPEVERAEALVILARGLHLLDVRGQRGELFIGEAQRGRSRHLLLENPAHVDQVVEERHVVVVLQRDAEDHGVEQVP